MSIRHITPALRIGQRTTTTREIQLLESTHGSDPLDLSDVESVTITLEHAKFGYTPVSDGECTVVEPAAGIVSYRFTQAETSLHGRYYVQFEVDYGLETELVPPESDDWVIDIGRRQPKYQPLEVPSITAEEGTIGTLQTDTINAGEGRISTLTGAMDAGGHTISDVGDPQSIRDVVPQEYVDNMAGENITGASNPATEDYDLNNYDLINGNVLNATHTDTERAKTTQVDRLKVDGRGRERWSTHGRMFDNFEDLTPWTAVNGTLEADTTAYHRGTQSAFATTGTDTSLAFERSVDLDLTDKRFAAALWVQLPDTTGLNRIRILVTDDAGLTAEFRSDYRNPGQDAGWRFLQFYMNSADSGINFSSIQTLRIFAPTDGTEMNIDALKLVNAPQPAKLVLGTDNINSEIYDFGAPIAAEFGWSLTNWTTTSRVGLSGRLTWAQMDELREKYGNLFANKASTGEDLTDFTVDEAEQEIIKGKQDLMDPPADIEGFHAGAQHFAFNLNSHNQSLLDIAEKYHLTARHGGEAGIGAPLNPIALEGMNGDNGLASVQDSLDLLFEFGGIGILYWHMNDVTEADYRETLQYIADAEARGDVEVLNIDDLYRSLPHFAFRHTSHGLSNEGPLSAIEDDLYVNGGHDSFDDVAEMVEFADNHGVGQIWLPDGAYSGGGVINLPTDTHVDIVGSSRAGTSINLGTDNFRVRAGATLGLRNLTAEASNATRAVWYDDGNGSIQNCTILNTGTDTTHNIQISSGSSNIQISDCRIGDVASDSLHVQGDHHTVINCIIEGDVSVSGGPHSIPGDGNGNIITGTLS